MSDLRLILLLIGVALIAGIYLWGSYQQRELRHRRRVIEEAHPFAPPPRPASEGEVTAEGDAVPRVGPEPIPPGLHAQAPARLPPPALAPRTTGMPPEFAGADGLPTLHVAANPGQMLSGRAILEAMRAADLRYGRMKIFHRYGPGSETAPVFSVADMFEPGSFDLDAMDGFSTRGLCLFMDAPEEDISGARFTEMLTAAETLARALGGTVLDAHREPLGADRIAALRAAGGR